MPALDNIQGIITQRLPKPFTVTLLFKVVIPDAARGFVGRWLAFVSSGAEEESGDRPSVYLAFSWKGLAGLLAGHVALDAESGRRAFEWAFTDPAQAPDRPALSQQLGFVGVSQPQSWWNGAFRSADIDIAMITSFSSAEEKRTWLDDIRQSAAASGLEELRIASFAEQALSGYRPPGGILHFGYRDGISQMPVDWQDSGDPGFVNPREFVVGYPTEDYPTTPQFPGPWQDFARDGTYLAVTWIYQDVARFNAFLSANAALAGDRELLAAKLVGRWRNGSPLMLYPNGQPTTSEPRDDFSYGGDPAGCVCPLNAHIRVVHPRDQELSFPNQRRFPQRPAPADPARLFLRTAAGGRGG